MLDFLAFGFTSGLVPWCAVSFILWAAVKNMRLAAAEKRAAKLEEERQKTEGLTLKSFPSSKPPGAR